MDWTFERQLDGAIIMRRTKRTGELVASVLFSKEEWDSIIASTSTMSAAKPTKLTFLKDPQKSK